MKSTHKSHPQDQTELNHLIALLSSAHLLKEKTRINLYLPKAVVKVMDTLAQDQSRSELIKQLIITTAKKAKTKKRQKENLPDPYGMFKDSANKFDHIDQDIKKTWDESLKKVDKQIDGKFD